MPDPIAAPADGSGPGADSDLPPEISPVDNPRSSCPPGGTDTVLSVVIPVHDAAAHLSTLLSTLAAQARPEIELVFVDDASTDTSPALLRAFRDDPCHGTVHVVELDSNGGAGRARRGALDHAHGRYITWLDVDDEPASGAFDAILAAIDEAEPGTILVFDYRYQWPDGRHQNMPGMVASRIDGFIPAVQALLRRDISPYMWNKVVPRQGLEPGQFHTRRNGQDWLTLIHLLRVNPQVRRVPRVLVHYRQDQKTLSRRTDLVQYTSLEHGLVAQMHTLLEENGIWDACAEQHLRWYSPRIGVNSALAAARRDDSGPHGALHAVAANIGRQIPTRVLLRSLLRGDREAAAALLLLRLSPRAFRRLSRR